MLKQLTNNLPQGGEYTFVREKSDAEHIHKISFSSFNDLIRYVG